MIRSYKILVRSDKNLSKEIAVEDVTSLATLIPVQDSHNLFITSYNNLVRSHKKPNSKEIHVAVTVIFKDLTRELAKNLTSF